MGLYGCLFRVCQAAAEEYFQINLTADEINFEHFRLLKEGAIRGDMYVNDLEKVIDGAAKILSDKLVKLEAKSKVIWGDVNDKTYSILVGTAVVGNCNHYMLGDNNGGLLWNPAGMDFKTVHNKIVCSILM